MGHRIMEALHISARGISTGALVGCPREQFFSRLVEVIEYAKTTGKKVMYAHCDALRTEWNFLEQVYGMVARLGVDRVTVYEDGYSSMGQPGILLEK